MKKYALGIDFGTLSGRAVLLDVESGEIAASSVCEYKHSVMDEALPSGKKLPKNYALQHPLDYIDVLRTAVRDVMDRAAVGAEQIVGVGFDFTSCTVMPVDEDMQPLCLKEKYKDEPHAYVKLWKHNSAQAESDELNRIAKERGETFLDIYGGKISPEWIFPKIMQILNEAPDVYDDTARFINTADWITYILTGEENHGVPMAAYKELWNEEDGFPSEDFFEALSPKMKGIIGTKICDRMVSIREIAGKISKEAAALTGLAEGTPVATPLIDAHASSPALGLVDEGQMMLILGTSSVLVAHSSKKKNIRGICGYAKDGVIPDLYTYEAGHVCCGDHFDWFVKNCVPAHYTEDAKAKGQSIHKYLRERAKALAVGESGLIALDWFNGNRSVLIDASLTGAIFGMTIRTKPEEIYRALIEGTAYGTKKILDTFEKSGVRVDSIVASGGIAEKDELMMQIYADVFNRPITVSDATMSASRGSAIVGAVAAGIYPDVISASKKLGISTGKVYTPNPKNVEVYDKLYSEYIRLYDYFGRGENDILKNLKRINDN